MPDTVPTTENTRDWHENVPFATIIWLIVALAVYSLGTQNVSLQDEERFVNDVVVEQSEGEGENEYILNIVSGTFEYGVRSAEIVNVQTGTYDEDSDFQLAEIIFEAVPDATQLEVDPQSITVTISPEADPEAVLRRLRNPIFRYLDNDQQTLTGEIVENTIVYSTTDERLTHARFVPQLIEPGEEIVYESRAAGLEGTPIAQAIYNGTSNIETLTIQPERLIVTYNGGNVEQNANRIESALNEFFPRANLRPDLWLPSFGLNPDVILDIVPLNTNIPLLWFALVVAAIEFGLFFYYRNREERLIRPLWRVVSTFLLFWSFFGHEPFWDALLSQIFPTSRQLVHPNATVIEFAAQHLELVIVSSLITIPAGLIAGITVTREGSKEILPLVNNLVNTGQTVPTIAIVAIMAPIIGFGFWPAIIALIAYGLLPVVRNTIAGLDGVDSSIIDSARGMGMTPTQILFQVELPIASSIIMAGIRTSMVVNVGTATLGAFVGSGGLGTPIASGLAMTIDAFILLGAIPAALLAILVDYILDRIEFVITPRGLQITN